jgi:hypothetical protein
LEHCRERQDRDIDLIGGQLHEFRLSIDRYHHLRIHRPKLVQSRQQQFESEQRSRTDPQPAFKTPAGQAQRARRDHRQGLSDIRQILASGGAEEDSARLALEQVDVQPLLEGVDAVAERAGREVQLLRGLFEAAAARSRFEQPQPAEGR